MTPHRIRRAIVILAASVGAGSALAAYPEQPIKLIVPFPAAGSTDLVARTLAVDLGPRSASRSWSRTRRAPAA